MQATRFKGDLDGCVPAGGKEQNATKAKRKCPFGTGELLENWTAEGYLESIQ